MSINLAFFYIGKYPTPLEPPNKHIFYLCTANPFNDSFIIINFLCQYQSAENRFELYFLILRLTAFIDEGLIALAQCSRLRCAELSWCTRLTDRGTCALASGCQDLEILSLHGILGITNNTINALAENCPSLHSLDINGCVNVQNRSREELKQKLPLLKTFILHTWGSDFWRLGPKP